MPLNVLPVFGLLAVDVSREVEVVVVPLNLGVRYNTGVTGQIERLGKGINDLVNVLPLSQSTITQHLKELKNTGIIRGEVEGPKVNYCIDQKVWEEARDIFLNMFSKFVPKNCC